jgi:hypothetical protein
METYRIVYVFVREIEAVLFKYSIGELIDLASQFFEMPEADDLLEAVRSHLLTVQDGVPILVRVVTIEAQGPRSEELAL